MASIRCAHCKQTHSTVQQVRDCAKTDLQARKLAPLEIKGYNDAVVFSDPYSVPQPAQQNSFRMSTRPPVVKQRSVSQDGMYIRDGVIYKVQKAVHGSGLLYAKKLVLREGETLLEKKSKGVFEYEPGAIRMLNASDRMSLEDAKEFGKLYGVCCVCGRTLTNEESIELGIGPVCGNREWK